MGKGSIRILAALGLAAIACFSHRSPQPSRPAAIPRAVAPPTRIAPNAEIAALPARSIDRHDSAAVPTFTAGGFSLGEGPRRVEVSLLNLAIGDRPLLGEGELSVSPIRSGDEVVYSRGAVTERYLPQGQGVEQIFVLDSSLQSRRSEGDLRIRLRLDTRLEPTVLGSPGRSVEFRDPAGGTLFRYGAAVAVDADGRTAELDYSLKDATLEMVLDRRYLADARFPVTIDPLIGFLFNVSGNTRNFPAIAFSPSADSFLVVTEWRPFNEIRATSTNSMENVSGEITLQTGANECRNARVAAGAAGQFLVVWQERSAPGPWSIRGRFVVASKNVPTVSGAGFTIATGSDDLRPDVGFAAGAGAYFVAWERAISASNHDIYGARVTAAGAVSAPVAIDASPAYEEAPTVSRSASGIGWIRRAASASQGDVYAATLDVSGPTATAPVAVSMDGADESAPALGGSGSNTFLAWTRTAAAGDGDVWAQRISFDVAGPTLGTAFAVENSGQHTTSPHCDAAAIGATQRAIFTFTRNATFPPTANGNDIVAVVVNTATDPPSPVETLLVQPSQDQDHSRVAVNPGTLMAVDVYEYYAGTQPLNSYAQRIVLGTVPAFAPGAASLTYYAQQGVNPFQQSFFVANVGGGTLSWTGATDQPWLSVTPAGTATSGSSSFVTATVNVAGLTPGNYSATITLTDAAAVNSPRTIPVDLTVASVTWVTGPAASYTGGQPINFTWTVSSGTTNSTLNVIKYGTSNPPGNGLLPDQPGPPGTFSNSLDAPIVSSPTTYYFRAEAWIGNAAVTSPVMSATINPPIGPVISFGFGPSSVALAVERNGVDNDPGILTMSNTGIAALSYTATPSASWLQVLPTSGTVAAGKSTLLRITADVTGLAAGTYSGTVTITAPGAANTPKTIPVTLNVLEVTWVTPPAGTFTSGQTILMQWNVSAGNLSPFNNYVRYAATYPPEFGSTTTNQPGSIGTCTGTLTAPTVTVPTAYFLRADIGVTGGRASSPVAVIQVVPRPALTLSSTALNFGAAEGGPAPASQSIQLTNTGGATVTWATTASAPWLSATPFGNLASSASTAIAVSINPAGLAPGSYLGTITIDAPAASNSPRTVAVTLTVIGVAWVAPPAGPVTSGQSIPFSWSVSASSWSLTQNRVGYGVSNPPSGGVTANHPGPGGTFSDSIVAPGVSAPTTFFFQPQAAVGGMSFVGPVVSVLVTPAATPLLSVGSTSLSFVGAQGGSNPFAQSFSVTNVGGAPLSWTAVGSQPWLTLSPAAGLQNPGESRTVAVSVNLATLPAGTSTATITVSDPSDPGGPKIVSVTVTVAALTWVAPPAGPVTSGQAVPFTWHLELGSLSATTNEVRFTTAYPPTAGTSASNQPGPSGDYSGSIPAPNSNAVAVVHFQPRAVIGSVTILGPIVSITVNPAPTPLIQLSQSSFTFNATNFNPAEQSLSVTNGGSGVLNWTVSSNAAWLSMSPTSDSRVANATTFGLVWVNITGLAGGTYNGALTVSAPGASNSPQTVSVTLNIAGGASNDAFADRIVLAGADVSTTGSNVGASGEPGEPGGSGTLHTVWWSWTAPSSGPFVINTFGSDFDTYVTVFTGSTLGSLSTVASNDDFGSGQSQVTLSAVAGTTYQIQVDGYGSSTGSIVLTISNGPRILVSSAPLNFAAAPGGANPASKTFSVKNSGAGTLNWTASSNQLWCTLGSSGSSLPNGNQTLVSVFIDVTGLPVGVHSATITVADPAAANSPQTVSVTLSIVEVTWVTTPGAGYVSGQPIALAWNVAGAGVNSTTNQVRMDIVTPPSSGSTTTNQPGPSGTYFASAILNSGTPTTFYFQARVTVAGILFTSPIVNSLVVPTGPSMTTNPTSIAAAAALGGSSTQVQIRLSGSGDTLEWSATTDQPWLTVSPASGTSPFGSPSGLLVTLNPSGLAPGTYNGTVSIFDPAAGNTGLAIPVSFTVASIGWLTPPPASVASGQPIRFVWTLNAGTAVSTHNTVHFGFSGLPGGEFESDGPPGGTGNYSGEVDAPVVTAPSTWVLQPHATILGTTIAGPIVTSTIAPPSAGPLIGLNISQLSFIMLEGPVNPPSQNLPLFNLGTATLNWTATSNVSWLMVSPPNGSLIGGSTPLTVSVDGTGLLPGVYAGTISLTAPGAPNSPRAVAVALTVQRRPTIALSVSDPLTFNVIEGGPNPPATTIQIGNNGGVDLNWIATSNAGWLTVSPAAGSVRPSGPLQPITISLNASALAAGTYTGTISFIDSSASNSPRTLVVTLTVSPPSPVLEAMDPVVTVTATAGGAVKFVNPRIRNPGLGTLNWFVTSNQPWLQPTAAAGSLQGGSVVTLTTRVDPAALPPGNVSGTLTITSPNASGSPQVITVNATILPNAPAILLSPSSLSFAAVQGGTSPASQTVTLTNSGVQQLNWTASTGGTPWLSVNPPLGSLTASSNQTLTVSVNIAGLTAGNYNGAVTVTAAGASNTPQTLPVTLVVSPPGPLMGLSAFSRSFVVAQGVANPGSQTLTIRNTGSAPLQWSVSRDQGWVSVSPDSGSLPPGFSLPLTISVDSIGMTAGSYAAALTFTDAASPNSPQVATVSLTVVSVAWVAPPAANYTGGQPISVFWNVFAGSATTTQNFVAFSTTDPTTTGSVGIPTQNGTSGLYSGSMAAPSVNVPTVYYFAVRTTVGGVTVSSPIVSSVIHPPVSPIIALSSTSLIFGAAQGGASTESQSVGVTNSGAGVLNWTATPDQPWISAAPSSGTRPSGTGQFLTIRTQPTGLAPGTYTGKVTVSDPAAINNSVSVSVTLTILAVSWATPPNGTYTGGQTISFSWSVSGETVSSGVNHVHWGTSDPPTFGTGVANQPGPAGTYSGSIQAPSFSSPSWYYFEAEAMAGGVRVHSPVIPVLVLPPTAPVIELFGTTLFLSAPQGGAIPPGKAVTMRNNGIGTLNWSASSNQPWLSVAPPSGSLAAAALTSLTVSADPSGLAPGTYSGTLIVTDPAAANSPTTLAVSFTVAPPIANDAFANRIALSGLSDVGSGSNVGATAEAGEPGGVDPLQTVWWTWTSPVTGSVVIDTIGSSFDTYLAVFTGSTLASLVLVAADDDAGGFGASKVTISATSGTTYQIQVDGWTTSTGSIKVRVSSGPRIDVFPSPIELVASQGGAPQSSSVTLSNSGAGTLNWSASSPDAWLSVTPGSGSLAANGNLSVTVRADPTGLPSGDYTGTVTVTDPAATNSPLSIPVHLTVVGLSWSTPPPATAVSGQPISMSWTVACGSRLMTNNRVLYGPTDPPLSLTTAGQPGASGTYSDTVAAPTVTSTTTYFFKPTVLIDGFTVSGPVVPVTVQPAGNLVASVPSLAFAGTALAPNPAPQLVSLSNPGGTSVFWEVVELPAWMALNLPYGTVIAGGAEPLSASCDVTGLPAGTYTGTIQIVGFALTTTTISIPVTLTVVVDSTPPAIASVTSTTPGGVFDLGDSINVTVNFSEPVTLAGGNLLVTLNTGAVLSIPPFGPAATVAATYVVAAGQNTPALAATGLALQGGATLRDQVGQDASLVIPPGQNIPDVAVIVIDTTPPTVAITDPTNAPTYTTSASSVNLKGTSFDETGVAAVVMTNAANGMHLHPAGTGDWLGSIALKPGLNRITVYVWDVAGKVSSTQLLIDYVPVDSQTPTVQFVTPTSGPTHTAGSSPLFIAGTAIDNSSVARVRWSNLTTGTSADASGLGSWSASVPLTSGSNDILVTAFDGAGNEGTALLTVQLNAVPDAVVPVINMMVPTSGATWTVASSLIELGGTSSDDQAVSVVSWRNAALGATGVAYGTTTWQMFVPLALGDNDITVTVRDPAGNATSTVLTVTNTLTPAETFPPLLAIRTPKAGPRYRTSASTVTLGGDAADNTSLSVVVFSNAATGQSGSAVHPEDGWASWTAPVDLVPGQNVITVTVMDSSGNLTTDTITVTRTAGGGGGGGGGGGCGLAGLDALVLLGILRVLRRRARPSP